MGSWASPSRWRLLAEGHGQPHTKPSPAITYPAKPMSGTGPEIGRPAVLAASRRIRENFEWMSIFVELCLFLSIFNGALLSRQKIEKMPKISICSFLVSISVRHSNIRRRSTWNTSPKLDIRSQGELVATTTPRHPHPKSRCQQRPPPRGELVATTTPRDSASREASCGYPAVVELGGGGLPLPLLLLPGLRNFAGSLGASGGGATGLGFRALSAMSVR